MPERHRIPIVKDAQLLRLHRGQGSKHDVLEISDVNILETHPLPGAQRELNIEKRSGIDVLRVLDRAMAAASNGIVIADPRQADCPIIYANSAFLQMTGYTEAEVIGRNCRFLQGAGTDPQAVRELREAIKQERGSQMLLLNYRKDSTAFWNEVTVSPVRDERGDLTHFIGVQTDVTIRQGADTERGRVAETLRRIAEREALLNNIGQLLLTSTDSAVTEGLAVALLGEALGVDRCYLVSWDYMHDCATILEDYRCPGLPSLAGEYSASEHGRFVDTLFASGTVSVPDRLAPLVPNTIAGVMEAFALRSMVAVSLFGNEGTTAVSLWAAMADEPRLWTPEEVSLVETVATLTRTAVEVARVAERERNIASQLQNALQPELPETVAGLAVAKYSEVALADEAAVGGDFYDVFALDESRTVLVVGDLSGKGLQAAAQVSIVRNMLRAFLYSKLSVADAINDLNRILAENKLLTGFSTLFAGTYDCDEQSLIYVNCGQEPALIRRSKTGNVEQVLPTGPILGIVANAQYTQRTVHLSTGDVLAIFTDGLTEVGATRQNMLGVEGVSALLGVARGEDALGGAAEIAEATVLRLITGVNVAAKDGVRRDDICLVVAVVK